MTDQTYYKLVRADWIHFGVRLRLGLNTLNEKFEDDPRVSGGGFYVCKKSEIPLWLSLYNDLLYICEAHIPADARVVVCEGKTKVSKMILSNPLYITAFLKKNYSQAQLVEMCRVHWAAVRFILDPTILRVLVTLSPKSINVIPESYLTMELCQIAVHADPTYLRYVPKGCQTYELCKWAVERDESVLDYIKDSMIRNHLGKRTNPWWGTKVERERLGLEWDTDPKSHNS